MAKIYLHEGSLTNPQKEMECVEFDIVDAAKYPESNQTNFRRMISLKSGLDRPYVSMRFHGSRLSFAVEEDGETKRVNLIDLDEIPAPFVEDLKLGTNIRKPVEGDDPLDGNVTWSSFTKYEGIKPSDWDENWFNYYTFEGGRWYPNTSSTYTGTRTYYYAGNHTKFFYVNSGLYNFSFGISTKLSDTPSTSAGSGIFTGTSYTGNVSDPQNSSTTDALTFKRTGMTSPMVPDNQPRTHQFVYAQALTTGSQSIWCQTYPVHFVIPAGMSIRSSDQYGSQSNTFTATKNTSFFGIISIYFNAQGEPGEFAITAMEDIAWKSETLRKHDYGDNTLPTGGQGPQKIGKFNPRQGITLAQSGGIAQNPTTTKGLVIYKFSQAEFNRFIQEANDQLSYPLFLKYTALYASSFVYNILHDNTEGVEGFLPKGSTVPYISADTSSIAFIKNSPVDFETESMYLRFMSVGSNYIEWNANANVVQSFTLIGDIDANYDNNAASFTDMEPYKSATIYCPLAGEIQVIPSYLENAHISGKYGFNLLTEAAAYALEIKGDNGYIRLSTTGQCAKAADQVIGNSTIDYGKITKNIVLGAATIATGGTTAPALATTAAGMATGFMPDSTTLSTVNIPQSATGDPYQECVYGGIRSMYLNSVKSERFISDDEGQKTSRAHTMGEYSYNYVESIGIIPDDNYLSVSDVNLRMESGMTKAEYDKIVAYLKEGVYI